MYDAKYTTRMNKCLIHNNGILLLHVYSYKIGENRDIRIMTSIGQILMACVNIVIILLKLEFNEEFN